MCAADCINCSEVIPLEKLKNALFLLLLAAFAAALAAAPAEASDAARQGLALCLQTVLPSLFPFFVLSSLVVASGAADGFGHALAPVMRPLFRMSGAGAAALALGLVGGYPVGARTTAELYRGGALSKAEAERLLAFCNNAGPGFILGVCGTAVLRDTRAGLYLYLVHVAAAVISGVMLSHLTTAESTASRPPRRAQGQSLAAAFPTAVRDSFAAVWSVCGFVVIFAVVLRYVTLLLPPSPLLIGFIELTNGVLSLSADRGGFVLCAVFLAWGGLSVHAQTLSVLEDSGLSVRLYFLGKAMQAALSAPLAWVVSNLLY